MMAPHKREQKNSIMYMRTAVALLVTLLSVGTAHVHGSVRVPRMRAKCARPSISMDSREVPVVSPIRRRLRRKKDAATLLDLTTELESLSKETFYLSKEVSLGSVASDLWSELGDTLPQKARAAQYSKVIDECSAGFAELGQAAQARLSSKDVEQADAKLASAGDRAKRAIEEMEKLAGTYVEAADEFREAGARQFNEAWRRDALRAVLALQRAPYALQQEMKRQRLKGLSTELRILGLHRHRLDKITTQDVRAARAARAKELHPDVRVGAEARGEAPVLSEAAKQALDTQTITRRPGSPRGFFGKMRDLLFKTSADDRAPDGSASVEEDVDGMIELNAAYDLVYKAVSDPVYEQ